MNMRSCIFKPLLSVVLVLCGSGTVSGVDLRPSHVICQSGGGMGVASVGVGWKYGPKKRWETDVIAGLVPRYDSDAAKAVLALKENFVPWSIPLPWRLTLQPLTASIYFTTLASKRVWVSLPDWYTPSYYMLPTKIRSNISLGQRVTWHYRAGDARRSLTAFYEIGTCDIYAFNAFGNGCLSPKDWLQLCIGARINF